MANSAESPKSNTKVVILALCLLVLVLLLIFFYKKLVKLSNGEYAIRNMVYKDGGIRDRTRAAALAVGSHLGVRLWPSSHSLQDGEEMQEVTYDVGQVENGCSCESDSEEEEEEERKVAGVKDDSNPHNTSSSEGSEAEGPSRHEAEVTKEVEQIKEEKEEKVADKAETSGGSGLLIDLKQFSGSAIWSEEGGEEEKNVTAL